MADVFLETKIPDAYIQRVINMLEIFSDKDIIVKVGSHRLRMISKFRFTGRQDGEGAAAHAERFIREFLLNGLRIVEKDKTNKAITIAESEINRTVETIPDGSLD